jgi:hypothetical protein
MAEQELNAARGCTRSPDVCWDELASIEATFFQR